MFLTWNFLSEAAELKLSLLIGLLPFAPWVANDQSGFLELRECTHYEVGKDQEKAQSEKDSHSKNRGGKKPNQQSGTYTMKHIVSRMSSYFPNRWPLTAYILSWLEYS